MIAAMILSACFDGPSFQRDNIKVYFQVNMNNIGTLLSGGISDATIQTRTSFLSSVYSATPVLQFFDGQDVMFCMDNNNAPTYNCQNMPLNATPSCIQGDPSTGCLVGFVGVIAFEADKVTDCSVMSYGNFNYGAYDTVSGNAVASGVEAIVYTTSPAPVYVVIDKNTLCSTCTAQQITATYPMKLKPKLLPGSYKLCTYLNLSPVPKNYDAADSSVTFKFHESFHTPSGGVDAYFALPPMDVTTGTENSPVEINSAGFMEY